MNLALDHTFADSQRQYRFDGFACLHLYGNTLTFQAQEIVPGGYCLKRECTITSYRRAGYHCPGLPQFHRQPIPAVLHPAPNLAGRHSPGRNHFLKDDQKRVMEEGIAALGVVRVWLVRVAAADAVGLVARHSPHGHRAFLPLEHRKVGRWFVEGFVQGGGMLAPFPGDVGLGVEGPAAVGFAGVDINVMASSVLVGAEVVNPGQPPIGGSRGHRRRFDCDAIRLGIALQRG